MQAAVACMGSAHFFGLVPYPSARFLARRVGQFTPIVIIPLSINSSSVHLIFCSSVAFPIFRSSLAFRFRIIPLIHGT